jgi:hypothetical protein
LQDFRDSVVSFPGDFLVIVFLLLNEEKFWQLGLNLVWT